MIGSLRSTASAIPSTGRPEGSRPTGLRTVGAKRPERMPRSSVSSIAPQRSASHGMKVSRIHFDFARWSAGVETSAQQSIGPPGTPSKTMISQVPARRQRREHEVLPHPRDDVEADGRELGPRRHPGHVGECEGAHRLIELRPLCIALEEPRDLALAGRDDDEVAVAGVPLEIVDGRRRGRRARRRSTRSAPSSAGT